jgi:hypothetical protein
LQGRRFSPAMNKSQVSGFKPLRAHMQTQDCKRRGGTPSLPAPSVMSTEQ